MSTRVLFVTIATLSGLFFLFAFASFLNNNHRFNFIRTITETYESALKHLRLNLFDGVRKNLSICFPFSFPVILA